MTKEYSNKFGRINKSDMIIQISVTDEKERKKPIPIPIPLKPKAQFTKTTNFVLLYTRFGLAGTGG